MSVHTESNTVHPQTRDRNRSGLIVCLAGTVLAVAVVPVMGLGLNAPDGAGVTRLLIDDAGTWQSASMLALFAAAALCLAAVRLGQRIGGTGGVVATGSGIAVAFLLGAYYASFAAGAVVATHVVDNAGPGLGEGTLVVANMVELTRYAPSLVLLAAALVARRSLPKPVTISAAVIIAMIFLPVTTWIAAILTPVWLGVAGAVSRGAAPADG